MRGCVMQGWAFSRRPATARRLSRQARRDQLVSAAIPLVARHGPMDLSLDDVAERVGVTRNLIYHYFPGGRTDLITAVAEEAERQLLGASEFDPRGHWGHRIRPAEDGRIWTRPCPECSTTRWPRPTPGGSTAWHGRRRHPR